MHSGQGGRLLALADSLGCRRALELHRERAERGKGNASLGCQYIAAGITAEITGHLSDTARDQTEDSQPGVSTVEVSSLDVRSVLF